MFGCRDNCLAGANWESVNNAILLYGLAGFTARFGLPTLDMVYFQCPQL